jgi:nucleotide-binding universal stress UspA family protein
MKRFKNILAVYNECVGGDDVLSHATKLAHANNADLTIIDVRQQGTGPAELVEYRKRLDRILASIRSEGVRNVAPLVVAGTPFLEIIGQVLRADHDLVIASAEPSAKFMSYFFGSTATHLMRKCPCPVWIVKPDRQQRYGNILACVNPSAEGDNELDQMIVDLALSMAERNGINAHVVHAWDVEGADQHRIQSEIPDTVRSQILRKHEAEHRARTARLLLNTPNDSSTCSLHLPRATEPQWAILDLVAELDVDFVVMGTVSRVGIPGFLIGNTAETVLSLVKCGVITVKPRGFVSPVALEQGLSAVA